MLQLSLRDARRLAVISQGLHRSRPFGTGREAVQRCIEQLGYVQIDTIAVINRSHHHTLWSRVPSYSGNDLNALQREGRILEYWAHAAAYLPMRDYRFCLPYMHAIASGQKHWRTPDRKAMQMVLDRVRAEGPLMARDFEEDNGRSSVWGWNWKPAKIALEQLFIEGRLIAARREGFQKVYDLPERVIPSHVNTSMPSEAEFHRYLIMTAIRAHGIVAEPEIGYLRKGIRAGVKARLAELVGDGEVVEVKVAGLEQSYFALPVALDGMSNERVAGGVHLLSPFDNLVIQRRRIQQLFDSSYQIECFVPEAKRQFGYYCLPILHGTEIVGRLDPKADRRSGEFIVKALYLEKPLANQEAFIVKLARRIREVAAFNRCDRIRFIPARRGATGRALAAELARQARATPLRE